MHLLQKLRHFIFLYHPLIVCLCGPCDTTLIIFLNCEGFALLMQTTFNGLRCICWIHLCCLIAQSIFVHSHIHCSCFTLLDAVTQTDVAPLPDCMYDLDQTRRTWKMSLKHPSRQKSPRPDTVGYLIVHLTPG